MSDKQYPTPDISRVSDKQYHTPDISRVSDELYHILSAHAGKYPLMEPSDAVKLVYQNEFGGGHLVKNEMDSLRFLRDECARIQSIAAPESTVTTPPWDNISAIPLWEDIGNGFVRVSLPGRNTSGYPLQQLNHDFVRSSQLCHGTLERFLQKLDVLRAVCRTGLFRFTSSELETYLEGYQAVGCPMVSHSPKYRDAYVPAYRVISRRVCAPLAVQRICALARERSPVSQQCSPASQQRSPTSQQCSPTSQQRSDGGKYKPRGRVLIAIDGRCAAGKSTFARTLARRYGWDVVHMDDFFPRPEQRTPGRLAQPGGNIDYERFLSEVLTPLYHGERIRYRPFDCHTMDFAAPVNLSPPPDGVVIIEGSYACHPTLWEFYDTRIFLTVDSQTRIKRITQRNGVQTAQIFQSRWIPMEETYFTAYSIEQRCDYSLELI